MLSDALVLATLSTIGLMLLFNKLPRKIRKFLENHGIFTDFITFILTYLSLGSTLTALTAGAMVAIFTSILIHVTAHKEDFMYLYDLRDALREGMSELKKALEEAGLAYRKNKTGLHAVEVANVP